MIEEKDLLALKDKLGATRDEIIKAKTTKGQLEKDAELKKKELLSLGIVKIDNIDEEIAKMEEEISSSYDELKEKIESWDIDATN